MSIPRPSRNDPAIRAAAVQKIVDECVKWDDAPIPCRVTWTQALGRISLAQNGYEIARDLENYAHVNPDADLVEILDCAWSYLSEAYDRAVKAWVEANDISPSLKYGDRITCRHGTGRISGFDVKRARYTFVPDGEEERYRTGGGVLIEYEAAEPANG